MPLTKDSAVILRELKRRGYPVRVTKKGHYIVRCPNGKSVLFGGGNGRGSKNTIARLKKNGIEL